MDNKKSIVAGILTLSGILGAWFFLSSFSMINHCATIINLCANIKGMEYIVVAAFLGLLPAFFKAVHDETNNRGAMKHS